jgi:arylsulfatase A
MHARLATPAMFTAFAGFAASAGLCATAPRPNLVFFIADDVPAAMLNYHRQNTAQAQALTPHLDRLAREGIVLDGQHIATPVCSPSRYTCLTGKHAHRSTAVRRDPLCLAAGMTLVSWNPELFPEDDTLPKALQQAGYRTGLVGKSNFTWFSGRGDKYVWHGGAQPVALDADPADPDVRANLRLHYDAVCEFVRTLGFDEVYSLYDYGHVGSHPVAALRSQNHPWITQGGLDFLDGCTHDPRPFFLYFSTTIPHAPQAAEKSWNADPRATPIGLLDSPARSLPPADTIPPRLAAAGLELTNDRAMMLQLDDSLGVLWAKLEALGVLDDTVIFFFNDNGQEGKGSLYQGGMNAPSLVWRQGGFPAGPRSEALISNIDFAPTLLELARAPGYEGMDGKSFLPVLENQLPAPAHREAVYGEMGFTRAIRKGDWKYIALRYPAKAREIGLYEEIPDVGLTEHPPFGHMATRSDHAENARVMHRMATAVAKKHPHYFDADQLYYLPEDPGEQHNLASHPDHAAKLAELQGELVKAMADIPGSFGELKP